MPTTLDTLEAFALRAAKLADRIGCGHSTQGGGMPERHEVDNSLVKGAARVVGTSAEVRTKALEGLVGEVLFALLLDPGGAGDVPVPAPVERTAAEWFRHVKTRQLV